MTEAMTQFEEYMSNLQTLYDLDENYANEWFHSTDSSTFKIGK